MMTPENRSWDRLVRAARRAPEAEDLSAPFGFATQVVARAFAREPVSAATLLARLSFRALLVAAVLAGASLALNYRALAVNASGGDHAPEDDPVIVLLDLS